MEPFRAIQHWNGTGVTMSITLEIVQQAVKQSVENIADAVANKSTPLSVYFQKVWDYVPILTDPTTKTIIDNAIAVFTNPSSQQLIDKSISLVKGEIVTLLKALLDAKKIRSINTTSGVDKNNFTNKQSYGKSIY